MQFTGRITKDAKIAKTPSGTEVVNFNLADNDSYKPKGSKEYKQVATFLSCAYWRNTKVTSVLHKGTIVTVNGRISAKPYFAKNGEPKAELAFHVDDFKIVAFARKQTTGQSETDPSADGYDDLPF